MNKENTLTLIKDFPELYRGVYLSIQENLMPFGFECSNGWFNLIYELSKKLDEIIKKNNLKDVYASQVKEKFGTLRFYLTCGTDEIFDLVDEYERKSGDICEDCGRPGSLKSRGTWLRTQCPECQEKNGYSNLQYEDDLEEEDG